MKPLSVASLLLLTPFALAEWCNHGWSWDYPTVCPKSPRYFNYYCCGPYYAGAFDTWRGTSSPSGSDRYCIYQGRTGIIKCGA
ncbi:hypothetical protein BST61_g10919 [Cercospora zeina]